MTWTDTIKNMKANLSKKHLAHYDLPHKISIIYNTFRISLKAVFIAAFKHLFSVQAPKSDIPKHLRYPDEVVIFKAWFCEVWKRELTKDKVVEYIFPLSDTEGVVWKGPASQFTTRPSSKINSILAFKFKNEIK